MRATPVDGYQIWHPHPVPCAERPIWVQDRRYEMLTPVSHDMHFPFELGLVLRGRMERHFRNRRRSIGPGQVWFCGVWEPHGWRVIEAPCEMVYLLVYPPMLAGLWFEEAPDFSWIAPFLAEPHVRPQFPAQKQRDTLAIGQTLKALVGQDGVEAALRLRILLMKILLDVQHGWTPPRTRTARGVRPVERVGEALQLLFGAGRFVSLEEAARACGTNRKTFGRLFKSLMGISFARFALRYRLGNAARELVQTDAAIKAVAAHAGFSDLSHFYRCFRAHYACTPAAFRRRRGARGKRT